MPKLKHKIGTLQPSIAALRILAESLACSDTMEQGPGFSDINHNIWDLQRWYQVANITSALYR